MKLKRTKHIANSSQQSYF